ncbi:ribonuclease P protein component [Candidatus Liberibacter solanacearum]
MLIADVYCQNANYEFSDTWMSNISILKKCRQFALVKKGESRNGPYFSLEVLNNNNSKGVSRIGFTVTKRQGCAVVRNRIRRRLKEVVRLCSKDILKPGHDYVIVAKRDTLLVPFKELCTHFVERVRYNKRLYRSGKIFSRET